MSLTSKGLDAAPPPILLSAGGGTKPLQPKLLQAPAPQPPAAHKLLPLLWIPEEGVGGAQFVGTSDHQGLTRKNGNPCS